MWAPVEGRNVGMGHGPRTVDDGRRTGDGGRAKRTGDRGRETEIMPVSGLPSSVSRGLLRSPVI